MSEVKTFVLPRIINLDEFFANIPNAILLNSLIDGKDVSEVVKFICDSSSAEGSPIFASCECGKLHGNYHSGNICPDCNTTVKMPLAKEIKNDIWLEVPYQIGFVIHPIIYKIIEKWMKKDSNGVSILESIVNPKHEIAPEFQDIILGQGFRYLMNNFWYVIEVVARHLSKKKSKENEIMFRFLKMHEDRIWCSKLPILSKSLHPITQQSNVSKLVDKNVDRILGVIINLSDILLVNDIMSFSAQHIEKQFFTIYAEYIEYVTDLIKNKLNPKKGALRKHIFGTRMHLTFRSVIVPITTPHQGDDIHIPWKIGLATFQYHILSILCNRYNYSVDEAYNKIWKSMNKYDFELDKIMQLIIEECPYRGFPILFNRNPSLRFGSLPMLFIVKVKPCLKESPNHVIGEERIIIDDDNRPEKVFIQVDDENLLSKLERQIQDETIGVSPLIAGGPNFDFDGDEMNAILLCEMEEAAKFMTLHPREWTVSSDDLKVGDSGLALPNQLFCQLNFWLSSS